jgi:hypothetical protein
MKTGQVPDFLSGMYLALQYHAKAVTDQPSSYPGPSGGQEEG